MYADGCFFERRDGRTQHETALCHQTVCPAYAATACRRSEGARHSRDPADRSDNNTQPGEQNSHTPRVNQIQV